jgi:hypothetical protein
MDILTQFFSGNNGKLSNMRLNTSAWVLGILFCIIYLVVKTHGFPAIPDPIIYSIPAVLGMKAWQGGKEEKKNPEIPEKPTV